MSLARKVVHSIAWVTLSAVIGQFLAFITKIILARLLAPSDFGLLAISLIVINAMNLFRDMGLGTAIIYKKDDLKYSAANTVFLILPVFAFVLFVTLNLSVPYIAQFFDNKAIEPIIRVLALTFIISSFGSVQGMLLEKELKFKKKVITEFFPQIGFSFVSIGLALKGYGVWSLVYGQVAMTILSVILLWIVSDWRPTFSYDIKIAGELFGYGKHVLVFSIILFLIYSIDATIIGKILGVEALGFYTMAFMISNLPAMITFLVSKVMFPTYSKLQEDIDTLRLVYLKTLKYVSMLSLPVALGIFIISTDFVSLVLGEKWMPIVPVLQVLSFAGLFRSIASTMGPVFQATGKPEILSKTSFLQLIAILLLIYLLIVPYGIVGVGIAMTAPIIAQTVLQGYMVHRILKIKIKEAYNTMFSILIGSIIMVFGLFLLLNKIYELINFNPYVELIFSILIGAFIYSIALYLLDKNTIYDLKQLITKISK